MTSSSSSSSSSSSYPRQYLNELHSNTFFKYIRAKINSYGDKVNTSFQGKKIPKENLSSYDETDNESDNETV